MQNETTTETERKRASALKVQVYRALEDLPSAKLPARILGTALLALIAANALPITYDIRAYSEDVASVITTFGAVSTVIFVMEYALRLWIADMTHPAKSPARARLAYMTSIMGIVDLLSFLPSILLLIFPISGTLENAVRVVRLVRLVKISRYMRGLQTIAIVFRKRKQEIVAAFMVLALLCVASSVLVYEAEHPVQPDKFDSMFTGIYWALTTMTSTGYGDIAPITTFGRLVGSITMIISIGVVAIPAGIFSAGFVAEFRNTDSRQNPNEDDGS